MAVRDGAIAPFILRATDAAAGQQGKSPRMKMNFPTTKMRGTAELLACCLPYCKSNWSLLLITLAPSGSHGDAKKSQSPRQILLSSNALLHQHCYVANRTWETAKSGCEIGLFTTTDSKYTHLCAVCLTLHIAPNLAAHLVVFESSSNDYLFV